MCTPPKIMQNNEKKNIYDKHMYITKNMLNEIKENLHRYTVLMQGYAAAL